jgi:hypothetical protein
MNGEYWIREDGGVDFADGDIGDRNHEGIVIDTLQRQIVDTLQGSLGFKNNFDHGEYVDWDGFKEAAAEAYYKELLQSKPQFQEKYEKLYEEDPNKFLMAAIKKAGVKKPEWDTAEGVGDARDYAMEKWAWKTYRDGNVDTWNLKRSDVEAIIGGLDEISNELGWSEKKFLKFRFTITVFTNKKHFYVTVEQLQNWLKKPAGAPLDSGTHENPDDKVFKQAANAQTHLGYMHPHYINRPGVNPFGDCVMSSFKSFMEMVAQYNGIKEPPPVNYDDGDDDEDEWSMENLDKKYRKPLYNWALTSKTAQLVRFNIYSYVLAHVKPKPNTMFWDITGSHSKKRMLRDGKGNCSVRVEWNMPMDGATASQLFEQQRSILGKSDMYKVFGDKGQEGSMALTYKGEVLDYVVYMCCNVIPQKQFNMSGRNIVDDKNPDFSSKILYMAYKKYEGMLNKHLISQIQKLLGVQGNVTLQDVGYLSGRTGAQNDMITLSFDKQYRFTIQRV